MWHQCISTFVVIQPKHITQPKRDAHHNTIYEIYEIIYEIACVDRVVSAQSLCVQPTHLNQPNWGQTHNTIYEIEDIANEIVCVVRVVSSYALVYNRT